MLVIGNGAIGRCVSRRAWRVRARTVPNSALAELISTVAEVLTRRQDCVQESAELHDHGLRLGVVMKSLQAFLATITAVLAAAER